MINKMIKCLFSLSSIVITIFISNYSQAEVVSSNQSTSDINIEIVKPALSLEVVSVPIFTDIELTDKTQKIHPINDFEVSVFDNRKENPGYWKLYYSLSFFLNEDNESMVDQSFKMSKGNIKGLNINTDYKSYNVGPNTNDLQELLEVTNGKMRDYNFKIFKEDIELSINPKITPGNYEAKQKVILATLPDVK